VKAQSKNIDFRDNGWHQRIESPMAFLPLLHCQSVEKAELLSGCEGRTRQSLDSVQHVEVLVTRGQLRTHPVVTVLEADCRSRTGLAYIRNLSD